MSISTAPIGPLANGVGVATSAGVLLCLLGWGGQGPQPSYGPEELACAGFIESVRSDVRTNRGGATITETTSRDGFLRVRAVAGAGGGEGRTRIEVWYDSLVVWRGSSLGRLTPDTDGLVGGRWRGWLAPGGLVDVEMRPYMPPEILAVTDLSDLPRDFFPPLPPVALAVGQVWNDSAGLEIQRLPDSTAAGVPSPLGVYRWHRETITTTTEAINVYERIKDEGRLVWSFDRGPLAWTRRVVVDSDVRSGLPSRAPLRGRVDQHITVRRLSADECD